MSIGQCWGVILGCILRCLEDVIVIFSKSPTTYSTHRTRHNIFGLFSYAQENQERALSMLPKKQRKLCLKQKATKTKKKQQQNQQTALRSAREVSMLLVWLLQQVDAPTATQWMRLAPQLDCFGSRFCCV